MTKVVVFGGSGFLGSYVCDELVHRGYDVTIADVNEPKHENKSCRFVPCDILADEQVKEAVNEASIVYNFAGLSDIDESINLPKETMEQNVIGNINVLEACRNLNLTRYVYASSAYSLSVKGSFYGISKLASEKIIDEYQERYDVPCTVIRYGSLYGERADHHNGLYRILRQALEKGEIRHIGDGEEVREYTHASDAAQMSVNIVEDDAYIGQHLILTGIERLKQKDLLIMIQEILNSDINIIYSHDDFEGHYKVTPYSFQPKMARKLVLNSFIDLGQGLVECMKAIHAELEDDE
jgi:UDP-glucose 4-epimerase